MGGFTGNQGLRLVDARLPSGRYPRPGLAGEALERAAEELWDALFGTHEPGEGTSSIEVETETGRYMILRDLTNDEVTIETLEGTAAPPPDAISPGWFLTGAPRPCSGRIQGATDHPSNVLGDEASRFLSEARELAKSSVSAPSSRTPARAALVSASATLVANEATTIEDTLRRDRIISGCLEELERTLESVPAVGTSGALARLSRELAAVEIRAARRGVAGWMQATWPLWIAVTLAGTGLLVGATLLDEPSWRAPGAIAVGLSLLPALLGKLLSMARRNHIRARRVMLQQEAHDVLFRARVPIPDDEAPTPERLQHAAEKVARRDLTSSLRKRLQRLALPGPQADELRQRRRLLMEGPRAGSMEDTRQSSSGDPLLGLPALLDALDEETKQQMEAARQSGHAAGIRSGTGETLVKAALRFQKLAERAERSKAAAEVWDELSGAPQRQIASRAVDLRQGLGQEEKATGHLDLLTTRKSSKDQRPGLAEARAMAMRLRRGNIELGDILRTASIEPERLRALLETIPEVAARLSLSSIETSTHVNPDVADVADAARI